MLGLPVKVREGLQEFDVGDFVGRPWDPVGLRPRRGRLAGGRPGRRACPAARPAEQVADRVLGVLDEVADLFRGETVLVVSHGGVILALMGSARPRFAAGAGRTTYDVPNCSTYVFERDADGWRVGSP